ncbi:hypothetical protein HQ393_08020 [Chitinibacter bivalviorum]|uniref:Uncharacterized protein n=1 Tax=Chitinibacter bivalviorum TaxID=2739434 RepID=A0A7H9BI32_9NEIS|nr:hypothetical protein [Chitinibacter bivalviorum]QLG88199.1 hypothetical protein HQ393_08020 [Chitinibacter bivalviorum]
MLSRPMQWLLGGTLAITAYTFWHDSQQEAELVSAAKPAPRVQASSVKVKLASAASSVASEVAQQGTSLSDLFPKQNWAPPPPKPTPVPKPTPTPVPVAPPFPLQLTSTWHEKVSDYYVLEGQGQSLVLCTRCDTLGRIQPGDTFLGVYRLDKLSRDVLTFTYLPLNQQQSLPTGGTP